MTELLRIDEAANMLRLSRSRTYELIKIGSLPCVRVGQRGLRVPAEALSLWIESRTMPGVVEQQQGTGLK